MELDWSTFILEIVNFAILVWLLVHFFYRPVVDIISKRRQSVQETLDQADQVRVTAESEKARYENRLADWEKEKAIARSQLQGEFEEERKQARAELSKSLDEQRERERVLLQRERDHAQEEARQVGVDHALSFSTRLLNRLAGPALEETLISLVCEDVSGLPSEQLEILKNAWAASDGVITVTSVWPVSKAGETAIRDTMARVTGATPRFEFRRDPDLVAGICIDVGSYKVDANLKSELKFFAELQRHAGE